MAFRDDRRGAAIQVGAVLLLGFLVIALSLYQVTVVPAENKRVEFGHSQAVQNDLLDLRNALLRAGTSESVQPVSVDMGTTYESRVLFVNPSPPSGLLRNGSARNVTVANANATNAETRDFLNAGANGPYTLSTKNVSYRPGYNVYRSAPTTSYQSGVTVNEFESGNDTAISGQTLVRGNRIYLVAVAGNLSRAQIGDLAVDPRSLSTSTSATTVRNTTGGNVTLTVPTTLSADRWRTLLATELDPGGTDPNRYVTAVSDGPRPDTVDVTLEANETYRLRTAYVGVGTGGSTPGPRYMTNVTATDPTLRPGDDVVVEVRDRYNNPVDPSAAGGVRVNVTDGTDLVRTDSTRVDENGRAGFTYTGGAGTGSTLNLSIDDRDVPTRNVSTNVTFTLFEADRQLNPPDGVVFESAVEGSTGDKDNATVRFNNTDPDRDRHLLEVRIASYYADDSSRNADSFVVNGSQRIEVGAPLTPIGNITFEAGTAATEDLEFDFDSNDSTPQTAADLFVLTARFRYFEAGEARNVTNDYLVVVESSAGGGGP